MGRGRLELRHRMLPLALIRRRRRFALRLLPPPRLLLLLLVSNEFTHNRICPRLHRPARRVLQQLRHRTGGPRTGVVLAEGEGKSHRQLLRHALVNGRGRGDGGIRIAVT